MAIVAASGNGSAPSTAANRKNNGGTFLGQALVDTTSPMTNGISLVQEAQNVGASYGSRVVQNDGTGANTTDRAGVSGVRFNVSLPYSQSPTGWIMRGGNVLSSLGGIATDKLIGGAGDWKGAGNNRHSINKITTTRLLGSGTTKHFDLYARPSGIINPGYVRGDNAGQVQNYAMATDGVTPAVDNAATESYHVPGELVWMFGSIVPTSGFYKPRDTFES